MRWYLAKDYGSDGLKCQILIGLGEQPVGKTVWFKGWKNGLVIKSTQVQFPASTLDS